MLQKPFPILQLDSLHPITAQSCLILGPFVDIVSCVSGVYRVVNQNDPIIIRLILVSKNGNCYYGLHVLEIVITIIDIDCQGSPLPPNYDRGSGTRFIE